MACEAKLRATRRSVDIQLDRHRRRSEVAAPTRKEMFIEVPLYNANHSTTATDVFLFSHYCLGAYFPSSNSKGISCRSRQGANGNHRIIASDYIAQSRGEFRVAMLTLNYKGSPLGHVSIDLGPLNRGSCLS